MSVSQNFTVDDTDPRLVYGSGWGADSPNDPALDNYFQSTYHATETVGANTSLTFSGVAIYLYGSMGPNHGNFSVRYDNLVELSSAQSDTLSYRQLLFSVQLPPGDHSVTLTYTDESERWLDLDYVTITGAGNTSLPTVFSSTISPPPAMSTMTINTTSSSSAPSSDNAQSKVNGATLILAITFGVLLCFLMITIAWYLIRHHRRGKLSQHSRGVNFSENPHSVRSAGSAFLRPQSMTGTTHSPSSPSTYDARSHLRPKGTDPKSVTKNTPERALDVEMRQWGNPATVGPPAQVQRPWSPFSTSIGRVFGGLKEGGESMKSTFLKV